MSDVPRVPNALIADLAGILADHHTHAELNMIFTRAGAPGDPPPGTKVVKVQEWLRATNDDPRCDPYAVLGGVLEELMDRDLPTYEESRALWTTRRDRVRRGLARHGLSYSFGGTILGATLSAPSRSLDDMIRQRDLPALQKEFDRATANVEADPPAAITAGCAILESTFKIIIADAGLPILADQSVLPLWGVVRGFLDLDPARTHDDDLKRVVGGLGSTVHGIAGLRTHGGSAHGRGPAATALEPRHARLTVHAAHTVVVFVLESWKPKTMQP